MDIQYVPNTYAVVMYVMPSMMKIELAVAEHLSQSGRECQDRNTKEQRNKIRSAFGGKEKCQYMRLSHEDCQHGS